MKETLVQWVLLQDINYLQEKLDIKFRRKLVEYYSTDYGIIDFALESDDSIIVVELETGINNRQKYDYCVNQVTNYKNIKFETNKSIKFVILYDELNTPVEYVNKLEGAAEKLNIILRTYSLTDIQQIYNKCLDKLRKTCGEYLGSPVAMDVVYLRWLNRIIEPFMNTKENKIKIAELRKTFLSRTSYGVYTSLAKHFELIEFKDDYIFLTEYGIKFRDAYNSKIISSRSSVPMLSIEQKRVLLETMTNGNFTKAKINIYYFLRFIHLTNGEWITKSGTKEDKEKLKFINYLFSKDYRWQTVKDLISFTCNQCEELGLVERVFIVNSEFDRCILTPLGSRMLGYLELYLHLKRETYQIPLEI